jgi:hypothetical protein
MFDQNSSFEVKIWNLNVKLMINSFLEWTGVILKNNERRLFLWTESTNSCWMF